MQIWLQKISVLAIIGVVMLVLTVPQTTFATTTPAKAVPSKNNADILRIFGNNMGLSDTDPRIIVARIIRSGLGFVGIVMLVMVLWGGLQFMVSGGDKEKVDKAKKTFYSAIIGLIIMLSAYSIVAFVFQALGSGG